MEEDTLEGESEDDLYDVIGVVDYDEDNAGKHT